MLKNQSAAVRDSAPSDYDIARTALRAAMEIDAALKDRLSASTKHLRELATHLQNVSGINETSDWFKHLNPSALGIFANALSAYNGERPRSSLDFSRLLYEVISDLSAKDVQYGDGELSKDDLKKLLGFCTGLHSELIRNGNYFSDHSQHQDSYRV